MRLRRPASRTARASTPARWSPATRPTGQRLVTGDAVNVAARLEQAAGEREVLLGGADLPPRPRRRRGRGGRATRAEGQVGARARVSTARRAGGLRRPGAEAHPSLDARTELTTLETALDEAPRRAPRGSSTIVGDAGVGKSRLTAEFRARPHGAHSRCPGGASPTATASRSGPGRGRQGPRRDRRRRLRHGGEVKARRARGRRWATASTARLASAIGLSVEPFPVEELFWAVRRLLTHLAGRPPGRLRRRGRPLGRADAARPDRAPGRGVRRACLVLCPTRPELLERMADWGTGHGATRILLEPLDAASDER